MERRAEPPVKTIIHSLTATLITEHAAFRGSMDQINSILKHAVELLNESIVEAHNAHSHTKSIELFNVISKSTKLIQAEDIISQITAHLNERSLEIDKELSEINRLCENDPSLQSVLLQIESLKNHKVNPIKQHNLHDGESELF
jgi:hypothetical protein